MHHAHQAVAETVCDPDVVLAIDCKTAGVESTLEILSFARVSSREARYVVDAAVRDPDTVSPIDGEVKRRYERPARLSTIALADNSPLVEIALGEVHELLLLDPQDPYVTSWRDSDTLHQPQAAIEADTIGRGQGLAVFVEYHDCLGAIGGEPGVVLGVDRRAERAAFHPSTGKAGGNRRKGFAIRGELGGVALPQRILPLPTNREIVADPEVAVAVEAALAACAVAAAVELQRQHPRTGHPI